MEKTESENDAKIGHANSGLEPIETIVSAVPVLGLLELDSISLLQLRGAGAEDRQGLLTDMENMEIAWEDFILEEPNTTKAFVQPKTARYPFPLQLSPAPEFRVSSRIRNFSKT